MSLETFGGGRRQRRLFIDCDGVLADFDTAARELLGVTAEAYEAREGAERLYEAMRRVPPPGFFYGLAPMPDAFALWQALRRYNPTILTGQPRGGWARAQKLAWRDAWFPGARMVVCASADKRDHCLPGDVLLDDRLKYAPLWRAAGGVFLLYYSAAPLAETVQAVHAAMRSEPSADAVATTGVEPPQPSQRRTK